MRQMPRTRARILLTCLLLAGALACHRNAMSEPASTAPVRITDGNSVAIILAANNTDLSYARLVPSRARSEAVKSFAARMTTDHTLLNTRVAEIALQNGITAEDHEVSLDFRDKSANRRDVLRELEGAAFDSTYAANEIQYHTELLAAIDGVLLPNARNTQLKEFITQIRPAVAAHLAHAEQVRAQVAARK